ncbi:MAG: EF-P lysine aminoacylase EpmA [Patescibacteria group bacterium]
MTTSTPNWRRLGSDAVYRGRMLQRSAIMKAVRDFFASRGFLEVETPILVAHPGMEPHLEPFATGLADERGGTRAGYLITSPEYSLKKLLAAGLPKIFEITRSFRNGEPWGGTHNPEFSLIEWYRAHDDYRALMRDTEELVAEAALKVVGQTALNYQGQVVELAPAWTRLSVAEAFDHYCSLDLGRGIDDPEWFRSEVAGRGCTIDGTDTFDDVFFKLFLRDIEPKLGQPETPGATAKPVILYDYPRSMAALARLKPGDGRYAERFEAYCLGIELGNAFSELNDAAEQRQRLVEEQELRRQLGKPVLELDEQFLEAVGRMPPSAGIAFGLDRLVMLLTDAKDIRDVLFFPASDLFGN